MARVKHVMRWQSAGLTATFLLAAAAGVAGNRLTGRLTPTLVMFAVLIVAKMLVAYVPERPASACGSDDAQAVRNAASDARRIAGRYAQGVQIRNRNRQRKYFGPGYK